MTHLLILRGPSRDSTVELRVCLVQDLSCILTISLQRQSCSALDDLTIAPSAIPLVKLIDVHSA